MCRVFESHLSRHKVDLTEYSGENPPGHGRLCADRPVKVFWLINFNQIAHWGSRAKMINKLGHITGYDNIV